MGIFTRFRDIISSNINAMLDKAEDPEKMLKLMLLEMEDTLIDIKAECAYAMAQSKTYARAVSEARERAEDWEKKARLAVEKGREDLAREALLEKRHYEERARSLEVQQRDCEALVAKYQADITQLEAKMQGVRDKQKVMIQRHVHARAKKRAEETIRRADSSDVLARIAGFEKRIDRMEAEADLVNYGRKPTLEQEFEKLIMDEELEKELERLRAEVKNKAEQRS